MNKWNLARRDLLKGLGVGAACLPLLQATKGWGQPAAGKYFVVLQMSEGLRIAHWKPNAGALAGQTLPYASAAFDAFKSDMVFIPDLNNPGGGGGHGSYGCIYYGLGSTGGGQYKEPTGKTIDQIVAGALPKPASGRISMHLHTQLDIKPTSTASPGGRRCFWTGGGQPITPEGDPYKVYKDIFGAAPVGPPAPGNSGMDESKKLLGEKRSILDYVGKSLEDFRSRLGKEDKDAIGAHFASIRELETQLTAAPADGSCAGGAPGMFDMLDMSHYAMILKAHTSLMIASLKCGVTNVVTLQTGDSSGNNINFGAFVEVDGKRLPERSKNNYKSPYRNWHDLGHNPIYEGEDHKRIVDKWYFMQWADMFTKMKAAPMAGGSLFDNTVTLIGNHVEDGGNHNTGKTPWMIAGGKNLNYFNLGTCTGGAGPVKGVMAGIAEAFKAPATGYGGVHGGLKKA